MARLIRSAFAAALLIGLVTSCTDATRSAEAFCAQLASSTGPDGAEFLIAPGEPERVPAVTAELEALLERAPDEIATTTSVLLDFFERYQWAPRDERRALLLDNQNQVAAAAEAFNTYALDECGLFLQRPEPTPVVTSDPGIEVAPE